MSWNAKPSPVRCTDFDFDGRRTGATAAQSDNIALAEMLRALLRYRWLIIATIIVLTGSRLAVTSSPTPRFTAEAVLVVGDQQSHMLNLQSVVTSVDTELTESQIQILKSRRIAQLVVHKLDQLTNPAFDADLKMHNYTGSMYYQRQIQKHYTGAEKA
jgi:succinoglycan biosynthesis transport protein ExoP